MACNNSFTVIGYAITDFEEYMCKNGLYIYTMLIEVESGNGTSREIVVKGFSNFSNIDYRASYKGSMIGVSGIIECKDGKFVDLKVTGLQYLDKDKQRSMTKEKKPERIIETAYDNNDDLPLNDEDLPF